MNCHPELLSRAQDQDLLLQDKRTSGKGDDRGRGAGALRVLDDLGRLSLHDGDARVGGAEVDADHVAGHAVGLVPHIAAVDQVVLRGDDLGLRRDLGWKCEGGSLSNL